MQPAFSHCNILQHLQQFATSREKTVSGQIEYVLSDGNGPRFVWTTVQHWLQSPHVATIATICNKVENYFIRANWVRSFQWEWSQAGVKNCCKADGSCNILQWVFPLSSELSLFIQLADRSHPSFLCWNPLVACCLEFIGGCNRAAACNNLQQSQKNFPW